MHTDDHILESVLVAKHPLPALAAHLGMTLIALVRWMDTNADLLAVAKRSLETHIAFLSLHAEAAALIDLTKVSTSTPNEERKRKSASQILRHTAKRLFPQKARSVGDVPSPPSLFARAGSTEPSGASRRQSISTTPPPSIAAARPATDAELPSSDPSPKPSAGAADASMPSALMLSSSSAPSPRPSGEKYPSTEGARGMRGGATAPDVATSSPDASMPLAVMPSSLPTPSSPLNLSDHEIDVLMVTLARHFNIDLTSDDAKPEPDSVASNAGPA